MQHGLSSCPFLQCKLLCSLCALTCGPLAECWTTEHCHGRLRRRVLSSNLREVWHISTAFKLTTYSMACAGRGLKQSQISGVQQPRILLLSCASPLLIFLLPSKVSPHVQIHYMCVLPAVLAP